MLDVWDLLIVGLVGLATSLMVTPAVLSVARRYSLVDRPRDYKKHPGPMPLLGGLAVAAGLLCGIVGSLLAGHTLDLAALASLGIGILIIVIAGLIDDLRGLSPRYKLIWQLGAASAAGLLLAFLGVRLKLFLGWEPIPIVLLTVVWIVGVTNAVNFFDNMDGLCAGFGGVAACFLAAYNFRTGDPTVALAAAALGGACLGFLPYNWPRARIFLGDAGSMAIGFALASLSVMGVYTPGAEVPILAVLAPLFVLAIPIFDSVLVILIRLRVGHPPWLGDRRHISHRLVRRGMHPAAAVATLWTATAACGFAALLLPTVSTTEAPLLVGLLACVLAAFAGAAGSKGLP